MPGKGILSAEVGARLGLPAAQWGVNRESNPRTRKGVEMHSAKTGVEDEKRNS